MRPCRGGADERATASHTTSSTTTITAPSTKARRSPVSRRTQARRPAPSSGPLRPRSFCCSYGVIGIRSLCFLFRHRARRGASTASAVWLLRTGVGSPAPNRLRTPAGSGAAQQEFHTSRSGVVEVFRRRFGAAAGFLRSAWHFGQPHGRPAPGTKAMRRRSPPKEQSSGANDSGRPTRSQRPPAAIAASAAWARVMSRVTPCSISWGADSPVRSAAFPAVAGMAASTNTAPAAIRST